ncbi:hypothetical protein LCGC14_3140520, partial [marine sediment metagenome]
DDEEPQEPEKPKRPGRPFADMPPSQQAGMLCNDAAFQKWVVDNHGYVLKQGGEQFEYLLNPTSAREFVLQECAICSRTNLDSNAAAEQRWYALLVQFRADTGRTTEQRR